MEGRRRPSVGRRDHPADASRPARRIGPAERRAARAEIDDPQVVLDAALRFLEVRVRSIAEVRRRLLTAGYRGNLVDAAVDHLDRLGLLDDAAFARAWVGSRDRAHPRGEIALRRELAQKGVARPVVDAILGERRAEAAAGQADADGSAGNRPGSLGDDDLGTADPDARAAARLLARHARALERIPEPRARRQRAYALLARHGFDSETAARESARIGQAAERDAQTPDS